VARHVYHNGAAEAITPAAFLHRRREEFAVELVKCDELGTEALQVVDQLRFNPEIVDPAVVEVLRPPPHESVDEDVAPAARGRELECNEM